MTPARSSIGLSFIALSALASACAPALAQGGAGDRRWSTSGSGERVAATDCTDCGDDIGLLIACKGPGRPAEVTVQAAAFDGEASETGTITIAVGGERFRRAARTVFLGQIGSTPVFDLAPDDPMIDALKSGRQVEFDFEGNSATIGLSGSSAALSSFAAACPWQEAAAPPVPEPAGADKGGGSAAADAGPEPAPGASSPDGAVWSATGGGADGRASLVFGIPETDAIGFSAECQANQPAQRIRVDLSVDYPQGLSAGSPLTLGVSTPSGRLAFPATVFADSSESAGVRFEVGLLDPLWAALLPAGTLSVSTEAGGGSARQWPLAGAAPQVAKFLSLCAGVSGDERTTPAPAPITTAIPAPDPVAAAEGRAAPQSLPRRAASTANAGIPPVAPKHVAYDCSDGSRLEVDYYLGAAPADVALVSQGDDRNVRLVAAQSSAGSRYTGAAMELQTKASTALLVRGGTVLSCFER